MHADKITIADMTFPCIIGVLPAERSVEQTIVLSVELELDLTRAAETGDLDATIDYARLGHELKFILTVARFRLLETAALALCQHLLAPPRGLAAVTIKLAKPAALATGVPILSMSRRGSGSAKKKRLVKGAQAACIFVCPDAALYHLTDWRPDLAVPGQAAYAHHQDWALGDATVLRVARV